VTGTISKGREAQSSMPTTFSPSLEKASTQMRRPLGAAQALTTRRHMTPSSVSLGSGTLSVETPSGSNAQTTSLSWRTVSPTKVQSLPLAKAME